MKKNMTFYLLLCVYTILLTALFFVGKELFFPNTAYDERYIAPSIHEFSHSQEDFLSFSGVSHNDVQSALEQYVYQNYKQNTTDIRKKPRLRFEYIPGVFREFIEYSYMPLAETFLFHEDIFFRISDLDVFLYQMRPDTRGRMKGGDIYMYGVTQMTDSEFLGVLVHEFAHYYDIYVLVGNAFGDMSRKFYDISWSDTTTILPASSREDFVSGYAMTNKYEDFAESYTYYVLHNDDFLLRSQKNPRLAAKYNFFQTQVFTKNQFYREDFGEKNDIESYYWDITKIPIDIKNFLQYMRDDI